MRLAEKIDGLLLCLRHLCGPLFPTNSSPFPLSLFLFHMVCQTCLSFTGISAEHSRDCCPVIPTLRCRRCHSRGHTAADCGESWNHWERPLTLEELIPADVRRQWNITSHTEIGFTQPRGAEGTETERKVEIEVSRQDKAMRAFMRENDIATTHDSESNLQRVRDWAMRKGFRLRLL